MQTIFDSAWVPLASGTVTANVRTEDFSSVRIIIAASGSAAVSSVGGGWSAGGATPIPWTKNTPAFPVTPLVTGAFTFAAPGANQANIYNIAVNISGVTNLLPTVPSAVSVSAVPGAASWARIIVEGQ